jgi:tripartite-type tricarboxylate transporter receptor subunit TctC
VANRILRGLIACAALTALSWPAGAADYPERPVHILVGFAPGGLTDVSIRKLADIAQRGWSQPILIENKPGASGAASLLQLKNAKPDGYTLAMVGASPIIVLPSIKDTGYVPQDFSYVMNFAAPLNAILVPADARWKTVEDLVKEGLEKPGALTYSTSGIYSALHLGILMLEHATGAKFEHVPYSGGAPSLVALLSGQIAFGVQADYTPQVKNGKFRALAILENRDDPKIPDLKSLRSHGYDVESPSIFGVIGPANLPDDVRGALEARLTQAAQSQEFKDFLENSSLPALVLDGKSFRDVVIERFNYYRDFAKSANIHQD